VLTFETQAFRFEQGAHRKKNALLHLEIQLVLGVPVERTLRACSDARLLQQKDVECRQEAHDIRRCEDLVAAAHSDKGWWRGKEERDTNNV
jgi:hypothetical protein